MLLSVFSPSTTAGVLLSQISGTMCQHQRDLCGGADSSKQPGSLWTNAAKSQHKGFTVATALHQPECPVLTQKPRGDGASFSSFMLAPCPPAPSPSELGVGPWLCTPLQSTPPSIMQPGKRGGNRGSVPPSHRHGARAPCTRGCLVSDAHAYQKARLTESGDRERGQKQP